jgi:predicted glycoside hydrolase/deacetylase ChbG (UPF0249 family)
MTQTQGNPRLIVNADDLGWSEGVTEGILQAHRQGIVTSSTLAANMPAAAGAITLSRNFPELGVGLHLNVCQGPALSSRGRAELAGADGQMNHSGLGLIMLALLRPRRMLPAIQEEFAAQIEFALSMGLKPTHLDSHRHVHAWPPIFRLVMVLAQRYDIAFVRRHREALPAGMPPAPAGQRRLSRVLNFLGGRCHRLAPRLQPTLGTLGVAHTGAIDAAALLAVIAALPEGLSELMVHPGLPEGLQAGQTRLLASREAELRALCDADVRAAISRHRVVLTHYGKLRRE